VKRLERAPPSREMDDRAIEALYGFLKDAKWEGESWETILRRRLRNVYDAKLTGRSQWMYTHFHVRWMIDRDSDKAATHVAQIWDRSKTTIETHAERRAIKEIAMQWIGEERQRAAQPFRLGNTSYHVKDTDIDKMLDTVLTNLASKFPKERKVKRLTAKSR
jgi:hypothetical protein